ncbi:helix-turn-helix domain-containing protein [Paenibacillus flagellatus]|nr:AraC family transcriptional regulator [Paenibacillus flagellatus]
MSTVRPFGAEATRMFDKWLLERPLAFAWCTLEQVRDCCFARRLDGAPTPGRFGLHVLLSGEGRIAVGAVPDEDGTTDGRCALTMPGEAWTFHAAGTGEPARLVSLTFRLSSEARGNPFVVLNDSEAFSGSRTIRDGGAALARSALELLEELERRDPFARTMTESSLYRMLGLVCRSMSGSRKTEERPPGKTDLVYEAVRYIDRRLTDIRELGEIAEALGYSYSRLSHVFRSEMGVPLQTYWNRRRIMRAMELLQAGEASITAIADRLHYQSVHSFSKSFKKIAGLSPTEYQELYGRARRTRSYDKGEQDDESGRVYG